ncbi:MAG: hypothetical protein HY659_15040 [Rhizobiales bacterium]|nr:hypothetical protein [Hyphomicrobiales bacterium]
MLRVLTLSVALICSPVAFAQTPTAEQQAACRGDADKHCKGVLPGGGRILACLAKVKDQISPDCRKIVEAQGK